MTRGETMTECDAPIGRRMLLACVLSVALLASASPMAHAEDNPLDPTPFKTPEEALAHAKKLLQNEALKAQPAKDVDLVGAVSRSKDGRIGFMPMLQHHMAVEHWFVDGLSDGKIAEALDKQNGRCFVRVRGNATLLGAYGRGALDWYGNGLAHGGTYVKGDMHVRGYHERVYRLAVDDVVWIKSLAEIREAQAKAKRDDARAKAAAKQGRYAEALTLVDSALRGAKDAGVHTRGIASQRDYLRRMIAVTKDPKTWTQEDRAMAIQMLMRDPVSAFREDHRNAVPRFLELVGNWPEAIRHDLAPDAIKSWYALKHRHQHKLTTPLVEALGGPDVDAWRAAVAEAAIKVDEALKTIVSLAAEQRYEAIDKVLADVQPYQRINKSYMLRPDTIEKWKGSVARLTALRGVMKDPAKRLPMIRKQLALEIDKPMILPHQVTKPRYSEQFIMHVVPHLTGAERSTISKDLVQLLEGFDANKQWKSGLVACELLASVGNEDAATAIDAFAAKIRWKNRAKQCRAFAKTLRERLVARAGGK